MRKPKLRLGFEDEHILSGTNSNGIYTGRPHPGTRAIVWQTRINCEEGRVTLNLYFDPPRPGSLPPGANSLAYSPNRCLPRQGPIEVDLDPLTIQLAVCNLVEQYKLTLPTEVTENETA